MKQFLLMFTAIALLTATAKAQPKKPFHTQKALALLSQYRHVGTLVSLLKTEMDAQDAAYVTAQYKKTGSFMRPLGVKIIGKNAITFSGLQGSLQFRNDGSEVTYRGLVFRMNEDWSFEKNLERIRKQLRSTGAAQPWWLPSSVADDRRFDIEQTGLHLAATLEFMTNMKKSGKFADIANFATNPTTDSLLGLGTESPVKKVDCGFMEGYEQADEVSRITITLQDGDTVEMNKLPGNKNAAIGVFADARGMDRQMMPDNIAAGYGDTFENLKKNYCTLPTKDRITMIQDLGKAQSHYPVKYGTTPPEPAAQ